VTAARFIPEQTLGGGTRIGSSYMTSFWVCPYQWYNNYYRGTLDDTGHTQQVGIRPRWTSNFLLMGSTFHEGIAAWYDSGVRDGADTGTRDKDKMMAVAEATHKHNLSQYADSTQAEEDWKIIRGVLLRYHDTYGPQGPECEYPDLQVAVDGLGNSLVEREFSISLGYQDYIFTSKPDMIYQHGGNLRTRDHKTSTAWGAKQRAASIHMDPQFTGEFLVLADLFPEEYISHAEVNVVVKNRSLTSRDPLCIRQLTSRTPTDLAVYKTSCIDILQEIDDRVGRFEEYRSKGVDENRAAVLSFPLHGTRTDTCHKYRGCQFLDLCQNFERQQDSLRHFKPRQTLEKETARELAG
jgi:hypothetical protein